MKRVCLNCKNYRLEDDVSGRCRVDRATLEIKDYPVTGHDDTCDRWRDAAQQYFIRIGWLKSRKNILLPGEQ